MVPRRIFLSLPAVVLQNEEDQSFKFTEPLILPIFYIYSYIHTKAQRAKS